MEIDCKINSRNGEESPFLPTWMVKKFEIEKSDIFCVKLNWSMITNDRTPAFLNKKGSLGFPSSCMSWFQYCFERNIFTLDTSYSIGRMNNILAESQSFILFLESCLSIDCEMKTQIKLKIKTIAQAHLINYELVNNYGIFADAAINALKTCVGDSFDILTTLSFVRFFSLLLQYTLLASSSPFESTRGKFRQLTNSFKNLFTPLLFYNQGKIRRSVFSEPTGNTNDNTGYQSFDRSISLSQHDTNDNSRNDRKKRNHHSLPFFNFHYGSIDSSNSNSNRSKHRHSNCSSSRRTSTHRIAAHPSNYSNNCNFDENMSSHHSQRNSKHKLLTPSSYNEDRITTTGTTYDRNSNPVSTRTTFREPNIYMFQEYLDHGDNDDIGFSNSYELNSIKTTNEAQITEISNSEEKIDNDFVRPYDESLMTEEEFTTYYTNIDNTKNNKEQIKANDSLKVDKQEVENKINCGSNKNTNRINSKAGGGFVRMSRRGTAMLVDDDFTTITNITSSGKDCKNNTMDSKDVEEQETYYAISTSSIRRRSYSLTPLTATSILPLPSTTSTSNSAISYSPINENQSSNNRWSRSLSTDTRGRTSSNSNSSRSSISRMNVYNQNHTTQESNSNYTSYPSPIITNTATSTSLNGKEKMSSNIDGCNAVVLESNYINVNSTNNNSNGSGMMSLDRNMSSTKNNCTNNDPNTSSTDNLIPTSLLQRLEKRIKQKHTLSPIPTSPTVKAAGAAVGRIKIEKNLFLDDTVPKGEGSGCSTGNTSSSYKLGSGHTTGAISTTSSSNNSSNHIPINNNNNNNSKNCNSNNTTNNKGSDVKSSLPMRRQISRQLTPPNLSFRYDKYFGEID